ncbi:MAG: methyltransferase [Isosphaeraceae bacterium]
MTFGPLPAPRHDPAPIFELYRGAFGTEVLVAACAHLRLFEQFNDGPKTVEQLGRFLGLQRRPTLVLTTALRAMGLLHDNAQGQLSPADLAHDHLVPGAPFDIRGYLGLSADSPGVLAMVERLRTNRPAGAEPDGPGAAFIFRDGLESAMDRADSARSLTMALAGRARCVAPALAANFPLTECRVLLDVGGGTGIYSIAYLRSHGNLRAIVWDHPEVLRVAEEFGREFGVLDRLELRPGDMFADEVPQADAILLSNILHDWDEPQAEALVGRLAKALPSGGRLLIHDVFLDDDLGGPLPIALYSASLFALTEGRAYSAGEYRQWLRKAGLTPAPIIPTRVHCGLLPSRKIP